MPNVFERFQKRVVGSQNTLKDMTNKILPSGDFGTITGIQTILQSWSNILTTPKRTFLFDPEYGSDLHKLIFEPVDQLTVEAITTEVRNVLTTYDNRAKISSFDVQFLTNRKGFVVNVVVEFGGQIAELTTLIDQNNYFNITGQQATAGG